MKYRPNIDQIKAVLRNFGPALTLGGIFYGILDKGELTSAILLTVGGGIIAFIGTLEKKS